MTLRRLTILLAALSGILILLIAGCSEERKREAARLENELKGDTTSQTQVATTTDTIPRGDSSVPPESTQTSAPVVTTDQPGGEAAGDTLTQAAATGDSNSSTMAQQPVTEPVADVNAIPEETSGAKKKAPVTLQETPKEVPKDQTATDQPVEKPSMPAQPHDGFTIQIASTPSESYANETAKVYQDKGYQAYVATGTVDGKTYYRVRIGFYSTSAEARTVLTELKDKFATDGWVDEVTR
ncbi:MAG: SPOR domain-containing protein [Candidatus Zixiibacteriota bacterium]